jgi:hypothetical protein
MNSNPRRSVKRKAPQLQHALLIWAVVLLIAGVTGYAYLSKRTDLSHADATLVLNVSTQGNDNNPGSFERPLRSVHQALVLKGQLSASALTVNVLGPSYVMDTKDYAPPGYQIPNSINEGSVNIVSVQSTIASKQTTISAQSPIDNMSFYVNGTGALKITGLRFTVGLVAQADGRNASVEASANDFSLARAPENNDAELNLSCSNSSYCHATRNAFTIFNGPFGRVVTNALYLNSYGSANIAVDGNMFKYPATESWPKELNPPGPGGYEIRGIVSWGSSPVKIIGNKFVSDKFNGQTGFPGYVGISYTPSTVVEKNDFTKFSGVSLEKHN